MTGSVQHKNAASIAKRQNVSLLEGFYLTRLKFARVPDAIDFASVDVNTRLDIFRHLMKTRDHCIPATKRARNHRLKGCRDLASSVIKVIVRCNRALDAHLPSRRVCSYPACIPARIHNIAYPRRRIAHQINEVLHAGRCLKDHPLKIILGCLRESDVTAGLQLPKPDPALECLGGDLDRGSNILIRWVKLSCLFISSNGVSVTAQLKESFCFPKVTLWPLGSAQNAHLRSCKCVFTAPLPQPNK
mmetsp:Transcript_26209/g.43388  ORF Transcript_26209/g.43388 Transcript_26209/m.43388 type:complete len:245 (-) Transcript_26209:504-1238(-)